MKKLSYLLFILLSLNLKAQLSGNYTIGSTGNYINFSAAISDLTTQGVNGSVIFNVLPGSGPYNEQIEIPPIVGASSSKTITFNGNGETITFITTSSPNNYIIRLNGANHIIFDSLNVITQTTANNFAIHLTNNADSNVINNCTINLSSTFSNTNISNGGIVVSGSLSSATAFGASGNYNVFSNNLIIGGYYGITLVGFSNLNRATGNIIDNNDIQDVYSSGIYHSQVNNTITKNNRLSRPTRASVSTFNAIMYKDGGENNVTESNKIFNPLGGNPTGIQASHPIFHWGIDATVGNENRVINNLIFNINGNGNVFALYNSDSDGVLYYHNTISLDDTVSTSGVTRGLYQVFPASNIELKNNVVTINRGGFSNKHCIYIDPNTSTIASDNNVFFIKSLSGINWIGRFGTVDFLTLTNWQTANGGVYDGNSVEVNPTYLDPSLEQFTPSNLAVNNIGIALGILVDINNITRNLTTPDPGAFEFTPSLCNLNSLGVDTVICAEDSFLLDAGSGFSTYSWSNGNNTQTLLVDSANFGIGIHTIFVEVTDTISGCIAADTIIVEITTCSVGINENISNVNVHVYPNPSKGEFILNLTPLNTTDLQIRITNIQGQEVFVKNNFDNINVINEQINIGNVKGFYLVSIITNNEVITKKIIVE